MSNPHVAIFKSHHSDLLLIAFLYRGTNLLY